MPDIYLIVLIVGIILVGTQVYAALRAAPWVPTRGADVDEFVKMAGIRKGMKVYDLGCGDGRLVAAAARAGAEAVGYEISVFPYLMAKLRTLRHKNAKVCYRDFWNVDLKDADVVYFFLLPKIFPKMKKKLKAELSKGVKVLSYVWPLQGWKPLEVRNKPGKTKIYLYKM